MRSPQKLRGYTDIVFIKIIPSHTTSGVVYHVRPGRQYPLVILHQLLPRLLLPRLLHRLLPPRLLLPLLLASLNGILPCRNSELKGGCPRPASAAERPCSLLLQTLRARSRSLQDCVDEFRLGRRDDPDGELDLREDLECLLPDDLNGTSCAR